MSTEPYTIYFAGDMFDHKHLAGNAILADAIEQRSNHKYKCIVPQTIEQVSNRGVDIRNMDLKHVMDCDLGIFNFDGPDLDSGTVVEFMYAKLLDIPAVILRTDFRGGGDGDGGRLGWNLMASFYPRTEIVKLHSLAVFRGVAERSETLEQLLSEYYREVAGQVIAGLDKVLQMPSLMGDTAPLPEQVYQWALDFPANGMAELCGPDFVTKVLARKRSRGLLRK
ncbi:MAG: nucleoside 2-deoxyribosyltransferase [Anaerolineales bacterium]|nr:nucleoside 2-deoxyribosyltransferase [Anaerolineales bacterium]